MVLWCCMHINTCRIHKTSDFCPSAGSTRKLRLIKFTSVTTVRGTSSSNEPARTCLIILSVGFFILLQKKSKRKNRPRTQALCFFHFLSLFVLSCSFHVPFISLSYGFIFLSYPCVFLSRFFHVRSFSFHFLFLGPFTFLSCPFTFLFLSACLYFLFNAVQFPCILLSFAFRVLLSFFHVPFMSFHFPFIFPCMIPSFSFRVLLKSFILFPCPCIFLPRSFRVLFIPFQFPFMSFHSFHVLAVFFSFSFHFPFIFSRSFHLPLMFLISFSLQSPSFSFIFLSCHGFVMLHANQHAHWAWLPARHLPVCLPLYILCPNCVW